MSTEIAFLDDGNIPLPGIVSIDDTPEVIEHSERTAAGVLRSDVVTSKRQWALSLRYLRQDEWRSIINHLEGLGWTETTFWIDDMPSTPESYSVAVVVRVERSERVQFGDSNGWESSGRHLDLTVREV